ncbi:MAG: hypothetical protein EBR46_08905, partial [Betaproteobacteria bacterium]|nr:hypothetical protein [Betaproteobacteria bacterium]
QALVLSKATEASGTRVCHTALLRTQRPLDPAPRAAGRQGPELSNANLNHGPRLHLACTGFHYTGIIGQHGPSGVGGRCAPHRNEAHDEMIPRSVGQGRPGKGSHADMVVMVRRASVTPTA